MVNSILAQFTQVLIITSAFKVQYINANPSVIVVLTNELQLNFMNIHFALSPSTECSLFYKFINKGLSIKSSALKIRMGKITLCYDNVLTVLMTPERLLVTMLSDTIYIKLRSPTNLFYSLLLKDEYVPEYIHLLSPSDEVNIVRRTVLR